MTGKFLSFSSHDESAYETAVNLKAKIKNDFNAYSINSQISYLLVNQYEINIQSTMNKIIMEHNLLTRSGGGVSTVNLATLISCLLCAKAINLRATKKPVFSKYPLPIGSDISHT